MKKKVHIKSIIKIIILSYIITFIVSKTGYYEYRMKNRTTLTNKQIEKFEEDVKNNVNVDINNYVVPENVDYSNKFTNVTYKTSTSVNKYLKKGITGVFKVLNKLVEQQDE